MNVDPFLFDDLNTNDDDDPTLAPEPKPVYTSPIEQATFDIMELVDTFFRSSMTVEEYDEVQRKVKGILTEAFDVKKNNDSVSHNRPLLIVPHDQD